MLNPNFPVVAGEYALTPEWTITLPGEFSRRFEDQDLVIWRPGITLWIAVWGNDEEESPDERLSDIVDGIDVGAFDLITEEDGNLRRFRYRLNEEAADKRVAPFYCFVVGTSGHVQLAIYFDAERDVTTAETLWRSLRENPAP